MVSVIIPTYNRAGFLKRAVESVLYQTFKDYELIVVDDGSTDDTPRVIKTYGEQVRLIRIPHSGVSRARNEGIQQSQGEWIAFLDSDDYWLPPKLQKQMDYLRDNPHYRVCHTDEMWIKNGLQINQGKKHRKYSGWFFYPSLELCLISPSAVIMHRELFDEVGSFDENFLYVEDYELWLRVTCRFPVGFCDQKLVVKTGGHSDQLSKKIEAIEKYRILALEKLITHGNLKQQFLQQALSVYRKKCLIYLTGCKKRGKWAEVRELTSRMQNILPLHMLSETVSYRPGCTGNPVTINQARD